MLTIVVSAFAEIRAHKLLAVRAVLIGGIALYTTGQFHGYLRYTLSALAIIHRAQHFHRPAGHHVIAAALSGWLVGRFHAQHSGRWPSSA
jgi:hypothetical protein